MAVLISRTSSPRLPSLTAVLRMVAGVSSHRRRCVVYIFISELRATVWVFFFFYMLTFSATEQRLGLGWRGVGRLPGE